MFSSPQRAARSARNSTCKLCRRWEARSRERAAAVSNGSMPGTVRADKGGEWWKDKRVWGGRPRPPANIEKPIPQRLKPSL